MAQSADKDEFSKNKNDINLVNINDKIENKENKERDSDKEFIASFTNNDLDEIQNDEKKNKNKEIDFDKEFIASFSNNDLDEIEKNEKKKTLDEEDTNKYDLKEIEKTDNKTGSIHSFSSYHSSSTQKQQTSPQIIVQNKDNNNNNNKWQIGSFCEIFSKSENKWFKGIILDIFSDNEGRWIKIKYNRRRIELSPNDPYIRPYNKTSNTNDSEEVKERQSAHDQQITTSSFVESDYDLNEISKAEKKNKSKDEVVININDTNKDNVKSSTPKQEATPQNTVELL